VPPVQNDTPREWIATSGTYASRGWNRTSQVVNEDARGGNGGNKDAKEWADDAKGRSDDANGGNGGNGGVGGGNDDTKGGNYHVKGRNDDTKGGNDDTKEGNNGAKDRNDDGQEDNDDDQGGDQELTVWNYYGNRGEHYDRDLVGDANNTVDSLLIFVSSVYTSHPDQLIN
jgi:hypothetical protein